ncbi:hypothetical protein [Clostridium tunisiense]|uniref:hypothetical protein n=1 Tax=Clostridium tunisiense TaxID=219748 RepID=UPI0002E61AC7|nr:hypothetical protein [Clostridium tunisiense]
MRENNINKNINNMLNQVEELSERYNVKLEKNFSEYSTGNLGTTSLEDNRLFISVSSKLSSNQEKKNAVIIHELGEALYILNKFPIITRSLEYCEYEQKLFEIFTHNYINHLVDLYNLREFMNPINSKRDYGKDNKNLESWKRIINICWIIIAHPIMLENKDLVEGYNELRSEVDKILNILSKVKYKRKSGSYMMDTINILKENGMSKDIEVVEQNFYKIEFVNDTIGKEKNVVTGFNIGLSEKVYNTIKENDKKYYENITISDNFKRIIVKDLFSKEMEVKDVYRYNIDFEDGCYPKLISLDSKDECYVESNFNDQIIEKEENSIEDIKSIVLVLESPHKYEYIKLQNEEIEYKPISPAQGTTGKNIENNLDIIISELLYRYKHIFKEKTYKIIICNPVPYQTSLYCLHGKGLKSKIYSNLRNEIWKAIFKQRDIKENFKKRIRDYKPELIINACTIELQPYIDKFIKDNFQDVKLVKINHPAAWGNFNVKY